MDCTRERRGRAGPLPSAGKEGEMLLGSLCTVITELVLSGLLGPDISLGIDPNG